MIKKPNKFFCIVMALMVLIMSSVTVFAEEETPIPRPVIIDTDFASDADDILAIRLALCYEDMGLLDVKGIVLSTNYSKSPPGVSALCQYDGYKNIPIGMNTDWRYSVQVHTNYVDVLCNYGGYADYMDSTKLYRKLLAESDTKVDIVTLGFLQNIQCLMNSGPDEYSPLTGMELIAQKVDTLYISGGNLHGAPSFNFYWTGEVTNNAARYVNNNYPGNIVYMTSSLGGDVWNGSYYQSDWRRKDPASASLEANNQKGGIVGWDTAVIYGMMHVMLGDNETENMFLIPGTMWIGENGCTEWTNNNTVPNRKILMKTGEGQYYSDKIDSILYNKFINSLGK